MFAYLTNDAQMIPAKTAHLMSLLIEPTYYNLQSTMIMTNIHNALYNMTQLDNIYFQGNQCHPPF